MFAGDHAVLFHPLHSARIHLFLSVIYLFHEDPVHIPQPVYLRPHLCYSLHDLLDPVPGKVVEEGALVCKHTPPVRGEILAEPWVTHVVPAIQPGEVVAGGDGVELVTLTAKLGCAGIRWTAKM